MNTLVDMLAKFKEIAPDWMNVHDGGTLAFALLLLAGAISLLSSAMKTALEHLIVKSLTAWHITMILLYGVPILFSLGSAHYVTAALMALCGAVVWRINTLKHRSLLTRSFVVAQVVALFGAYAVEGGIKKKISNEKNDRIQAVFILPYEDAGLRGATYQTELSENLRFYMEQVFKPVADVVTVQPAKFDTKAVNDWCYTCSGEDVVDRLNHLQLPPKVVLESYVSGDRSHLILLTILYPFRNHTLVDSPIRYLHTAGSALDARLLALNLTFHFYFEFVKDSRPQLTLDQMTQINRKFLNEYRKLLLLRGEEANRIVEQLDTLINTDPLRPEAVSTLFELDDRLQGQEAASAVVDAKRTAYLAKLPSKLP